LRAALGLLLGVLAVPAFALGLGQIRVKSRPGQPLLAEIPIVTSDPTELQGLQARLASPDTFRRIGLEPPRGIVSGLRFEPALDQDGKPVIRVTSVEPVQQAVLTFLVEVDWGQGRLVREYSALVDPPRSLAATAAPQVQAPEATGAPTIQRPAPDATPVPAPPAAETQASQTAASPTAVSPSPSPAAPAQAATTPAPPTEERPSSTNYAVKAGDTLSEIAGRLGDTGGYSLDQTMLALLRSNPEAFIGEDINRLRAGAVLRMPSQDELSRYGTAQASAMVREQVANWRRARQAQAQPAAAPADAGARTAEGAAPDAGAKRVADARLEIAPPPASAGAQADTQSGASAGGEGEMLRQELQQTKETLAARDAEVTELKARVAELEQLQKEQQRLLAMKDDALAGAQQRLAATNAAQQAPSAPADASSTAAGSGPAWWWLLPVALVAGALGWWFRRRRAGAPAPATQRVSDSFAKPATAKAAAKTARADAEPPPAAPAPVWAGKTKQAPPASPSVSPPPPPVDAAPTWMQGSSTEAGTAAASDQAPPGRARIELARAYADLGDHGVARSLLQEVIAGGDAQAREEAERVLQSLR
jgi:pilus assembly protein FimV